MAEVGRKILVITGPTASGKTGISLELASRFNAEILSADSRQVYERLDIGTAKPTVDQLLSVPHHLISHVPITSTYSAGTFFRESQDVIQDIQERGKVPLVVGGTGLYVRTLVEGIFDSPEVDPQLREDLQSELEHRGIEPLFARLQQLDPNAASFVPMTNHPRVLRALEVCILTGQPYSRIRRERMKKPKHKVQVVGLRWNRDALYARINSRVEQMMEQGFLDEVQDLLDRGIDPSSNALRTVGYKEAIAHLGGEYGKERMIELMKQNTRRFAKRQYTWFRKERYIDWIDVSDSTSAAEVTETIIDRWT